VNGARAAEPGFVGGGFPEIEETRIPRALSATAEGLVAEADGRLHSLLVPVHGRRGHRLGLVGMTFAEVPSGFDAETVRRRVMSELGVQSEVV
jgi:hypothetical protein